MSFKLPQLFIIAITLSFFACKNNEKQANSQNQDRTATTSTSAQKEAKNIVFFGTSLTAGYGLEPGQAYPELIQHRLDSLSLPYNAVNAGLSGETSAAGKGRIGWLLKQHVSIFVLELGANDGLRGIPVKETTSNLQAIIDSVKTSYPDAKLMLAGMEVPPNMGDKYAADFRGMFKLLAEKNNMTFLPFLLKDVAGIPKLNQKDGIHPTKMGQTIVAKNVWNTLEPLL
jgi:acyl-CoA thioesterase-1